MVYSGRKQEERVYINQGRINRKACTYGINKKFASLLSIVCRKTNAEMNELFVL